MNPTTAGSDTSTYLPIDVDDEQVPAVPPLRSNGTNNSTSDPNAEYTDGYYVLGASALPPWSQVSCSGPGGAPE
ncbi:MAG: hypothetical protein IPG69_21300 [Flavobacteriales bacterium]|nr:hypothetical protein [Flavobacteriales bacterium]